MQSKPVNGPRKSNSPIPHAATSLPNDIETLKAMLMAERAARLAAESEAQNRALLIERLKYIIKKLRHEQLGAHRKPVERLSRTTTCSRASRSSKTMWLPI
jgi:hypothetical protein